MTGLPDDPIYPGGIADYGRRLRAGSITAAAATEAYLARIRALEPKIGAFMHVAEAGARAAAQAIDRLLAAGTDLGPLMGVPVAVKDLFKVDGTPPPTAGSRLDVTEVIGAEGPFVQSLRRAGCIILGTTKTVEFAAGGLGLNNVRGTPWNPWDAAVHRAPGGSSSGSGAAQAAGMCAWAVGTDTGGSVRMPAAFCGVFGYKSTAGLWSTKGAWPMSRLLDSIGPLCAGADDAALIFAVLTGQTVPPPPPVKGLRLGRPTNHFFDRMDAAVADATERAFARLQAAGAELVPVPVPEAEERVTLFNALIPNELVATLGRERFLREKDAMDPVVAVRMEAALGTTADAYIAALHRTLDLRDIIGDRFRDLDGWVTPTIPIAPPPMSGAADVRGATKLNLISTQNTAPGNLFGLCGVSLPIHHLTGALPVGLQVMGHAGRDARLLSVAAAVEGVLGRGARADLSGFL